METRVFILCAGSEVRWNSHMGIPKQLIRFNDITLIERIIRQLRAVSYHGDVFIVSRNLLLHKDKNLFLFPKKNSSIIETIYSIKNMWTDRNIFLLGDVFYSNSAITQIISNEQNILFFGRVGKNYYSRCEHGEIFAFMFNLNQDAFLSTKIQLTLKYAQQGMKNGRLWDLYHQIAFSKFFLYRKGMKSGPVESRFFKSIDDFTDDFDTPEEYEACKERYSVLASGSLGKVMLLTLKIELIKVIDILRTKFFKTNHFLEK